MLKHTHNNHLNRWAILGFKHNSAIIKNSENIENSFPDGKILQYENLFTGENLNIALSQKAAYVARNPPNKHRKHLAMSSAQVEQENKVIPL